LAKTKALPGPKSHTAHYAQTMATVQKGLQLQKIRETAHLKIAK
jgi:hypothetical protein